MRDIHPMRCRCGSFRAELTNPRAGIRAVCYCRDCQSYAHFLGPPPGMLDALGGTEVVVAQPRQIRICEGLDQLVCMSLSPKGTLRWFAACCRTPFANTPRDMKLPHVGLIHSMFDADADTLDAMIGPVRMYVNRGGAHGVPPSNRPVALVGGFVRYAGRMAASRLGGGYRVTPFFDASGRARAEPEVISREQRERLRIEAARRC